MLRDLGRLDPPCSVLVCDREKLRDDRLVVRVEVEAVSDEYVEIQFACVTNEGPFPNRDGVDGPRE